MKCLIYVTRGKPYIYGNPEIYGDIKLNGKIVAVSDYEVEEIKDKVSWFDSWFNEGYHTKTMKQLELQKRSCLTFVDLVNYLGGGNPDEIVGYAINIKNLYKFIKPKELKDLYIKGAYNNAEQMFTDEIQINGEWFRPLKKAPQNMMYVYDKDGVKYILISIRPEWACKILNGEKTIEVRKQVLNCMKGN